MWHWSRPANDLAFHCLCRSFRDDHPFCAQRRRARDYPLRRSRFSAERFALPGTAVVDDQPKEGSDSQNFWTDQGLFDNSDDPSAASERAPAGGDPEIKALQEEFPETNWPKNTD